MGVFVTCVGVDDFGAPHCLSCGELLFGSSVLLPFPFQGPVVMLLLFRHSGPSMLFEVLRRKGWSPRVACGRLCIVGPATAGILRWRRFCCRCKRHLCPWRRSCQGLHRFFATRFHDGSSSWPKSPGWHWNPDYAGYTDGHFGRNRWQVSPKRRCCLAS